MAVARSPNYPALGLSEAVQLAEKLWRKEQRAAVSPDVAVKAFGYQSLSGPARVAIGAMRKYGLLDKTPNGIRLSELGLRILHPASQEARHEAIREAAFKPDLFRDMQDAGGSDEALRSFLITKKRFVERGTRAAIAAFRDTMALVNGAGKGYSADNGAKEPDRMAEPIQTSAHTAATRPQERVLNWVLSKDATAELRLKGDITPEDLDLLEEYVGITKRALSREQKAREQ